MRVLLSYHYFKQVNLDDFIGRFPEPPDVFADSGAYSARSVGAEIRLSEYTAWLKRWRHHFTTMCNLDVIGDAGKTDENQKRLEDAGLNVLPVFHGTFSPWEELHRLCEQYPYVGLGGLVVPGDVFPSVIKAFRIGREHGTVFHGFGETQMRINRDIPWFSVDSSSWGSAYRYGGVNLWDDRKKGWTKVTLRDRRSIYKNARLIRAHGEEPDFLMNAGNTRDRLREPKNERRRLARLSADAWRRFEGYLQRRHRVPLPSSLDGGAVGTRVYLADGQPQLLLMGAGAQAT